MVTNCVFDAPYHRLGTRISSGPSRAMPKLNIVYSVHHRPPMLPRISMGNHQGSLGFASEAQEWRLNPRQLACCSYIAQQGYLNVGF